ncbi:MAG TPA: Stp1/IreP family PP2C-type Ser/Thr phosphatase [Acidimicrobiales bacterium]|nr:Stp1/IreP family PP2C-type Ser/Thr phosphatase [Acidimicrobiales bacterium]
MAHLVAGAATDVGLVRSANQDSYLVCERAALYAVADGMGGHAAGEVASATAVAALEDTYLADASATPQALARAAEAANRAVFERARTDPAMHGMGTTLVAVALTSGQGGPTLAVANVGDSRCYRLRDGELEQLTVDHSLVGELVAQGRLAADEAEFHPQRNVLTRAVGVDADVPVDLFEVDAFTGDRLLLCSDGLIRELSDRAVASILRRRPDPDEAARELVGEARLSGGSDNITVIVVDVIGDDDRAAVASQALAAPGAADAAAMPDRADEPADDPAAERTGTVPVVADEATSVVPVITSTPRLAPPPAVPPRPPRQRLVTVRVVAFAVVLLAVLAAAALGVALYARGTYFVGVGAGGQVTIFKGRPGGLLWFQPTVAQRTGVPLSSVVPADQAALRAGMLESSLADARAYVQRVQVPPIPTTTVPAPATTPATTVAPPASATTTVAPTSPATPPPSAPAGTP